MRRAFSSAEETVDAMEKDSVARLRGAAATPQPYIAAHAVAGTCCTKSSGRISMHQLSSPHRICSEELQ